MNRSLPLILVSCFLSHPALGQEATQPAPFDKARQDLTVSLKAMNDAGEKAKQSSQALYNAAACSLNPSRTDDMKEVADAHRGTVKASQEVIAEAEKLGVLPAGMKGNAPKGAAKKAGQAAALTELNEKFFDEYLVTAETAKQKLFPEKGKSNFDNVTDKAMAALLKNQKGARAKAGKARFFCGVADLNRLYENSIRNLRALKNAYRSEKAAAEDSSVHGRLSGLIQSTRSEQSVLADRAKALSPIVPLVVDAPESVAGNP